jgi:hypothetical protein
MRFAMSSVSAMPRRGLGSMIYALVKIGRLLEDDLVLGNAAALVDWITLELIAATSSWTRVGELCL